MTDFRAHAEASDRVRDPGDIHARRVSPVNKPPARVRISCVQVKKAAFRPSSFWIRTSQT